MYINVEFSGFNCSATQTLICGTFCAFTNPFSSAIANLEVWGLMGHLRSRYPAVNRTLVVDMMMMVMTGDDDWW